MGKKSKQDESYAYATMKKFTELESRVTALEELLTKPKGTKDVNDKQSETESGQGSGKSEPVSENQSGSNAVQGKKK